MEQITHLSIQAVIFLFTIAGVYWKLRSSVMLLKARNKEQDEIIKEIRAQIDEKANKETLQIIKGELKEELNKMGSKIETLNTTIIQSLKK